MRLSELIHKPVADANGVVVGYLQDIRMEQDGPILGTWGAAFRASSILIVPHKWLSQFGYESEHTHGPWILKMLANVFYRRTVRLPWSAIESCDGSVIKLRPAS